MKKRMLLQRCSTNLLALIVFTLFARAAAPQTGKSQAEAPYMTMEALSRAVVYLQGEKQRVTTIAGREYELGIRAVGESQFGPWTESVSGTGFIIAAKNQVFIVTADHVARELRMNAKVTLLGEDGKSNTIELKTLLGAASNSRWTAHDWELMNKLTGGLRN